MKTMLRMILAGFAIGLIVALFVTNRGRDVRATLTDTARSALNASGLSSPGAGSAETEDGDLQARIEETRRRLKEQLAEDITGES